MSRWSQVLVLSLTALAWSVALAVAQVKPEEPAQPPGGVNYEPVAPGVYAAALLKTDALRGVTVEVKDFLLGPRKSVPDMPARGFAVTELKAGEVETTIDGHTARRRPGDFWLVRPGQKYAIRSIGGMVVLHAVIFTRQ